MQPRRYSLVRNDGRIWIDEPVMADRASAGALRRSLHEVEAGKLVRLVIDTTGGHCDEGFAIYTALRECGRPIEVVVRRAFSIGAVIAMAGDRIGVEERGSFFLHSSGFSRDEVSGFAAHMTAETFRAAARRLDQSDAVSLDIFERRTRLPRSQIATLLASETTLDACRAVELGFADSIIPQETIDG